MFVKIHSPFTTFVVTDQQKLEGVFLSFAMIELLPSYLDRVGRVGWCIYSELRTTTAVVLLRVQDHYKPDMDATDELANECKICTDSKLWRFIKKNYEAIKAIDRNSLLTLLNLSLDECLPGADSAGTKHPAEELVKYLGDQTTFSQEDIETRIQPLKNAILKHDESIMWYLRSKDLDCSPLGECEVEIQA